MSIEKTIAVLALGVSAALGAVACDEPLPRELPGGFERRTVENHRPSDERARSSDGPVVSDELRGLASP